MTISRQLYDGTAACCRCLFWQEAGATGHCRVEAPRVVAGHDEGVWPLTGAREWCGRFTPTSPARDTGVPK